MGNAFDLSCIWDVLGSNLGWKSGYPDRFFVVFMSLQAKAGIVLKWVSITSSQILSNSSVFPTFDAYIVQVQRRKLIARSHKDFQTSLDQFDKLNYLRY
jgi:hypothetical protein